MVEGHLPEAELFAATDILDGHVADESPACVALLVVRLIVQLLTRPERSAFGRDVELPRLVHHSEVVVAHQANRYVLDQHIQTLPRLGTIAQDVAQAYDLIDPALGYVFQNGQEGVGIRMYVTYYCDHYLTIPDRQTGG